MKTIHFSPVLLASVLLFSGCASTGGNNITATSINSAASKPGAIMSQAQAEQINRQQVARMNEAETQMAGNAAARDGVDTSLHGINAVAETAVNVGSSLKALELLNRF
ncbi:hypothetical protein HMY34_07030 [Thiothrix subterranea]|uniref:NGK_0946 family protein n=1 Tax=Thiothrix subterranea TaxID=2735563 RepID=UPI00192A7448|nr:hypothetical protein [Thiothrix subterranea]QQZ28530.1 hypothetical protein HMY34_07030 [Thiothrix subterranea]